MSRWCRDDDDDDDDWDDERTEIFLETLLHVRQTRNVFVIERETRRKRLIWNSSVSPRITRKRSALENQIFSARKENVSRRARARRAIRVKGTGCKHKSDGAEWRYIDRREWKSQQFGFFLFEWAIGSSWIVFFTPGFPVSPLPTTSSSVSDISGFDGLLISIGGRRPVSPILLWLRFISRYNTTLASMLRFLRWRSTAAQKKFEQDFFFIQHEESFGTYCSIRMVKWLEDFLFNVSEVRRKVPDIDNLFEK